MTRLFFDVVGQNVRAFDFHGRYFRDPNDAHEHAKLMSLDLGCSQAEGAEIQVRDTNGQRLFTVPIVMVEELRPAA